MLVIILLLVEHTFRRESAYHCLCCFCDVVTPHAHARAGGYVLGAGVHIYNTVYVYSASSFEMPITCFSHKTISIRS